MHIVDGVVLAGEILINLSSSCGGDVLYGVVCSDLLETFMQFVSCQDDDILWKPLVFSSVSLMSYWSSNKCHSWDAQRDSDGNCTWRVCAKANACDRLVKGGYTAKSPLTVMSLLRYMANSNQYLRKCRDSFSCLWWWCQSKERSKTTLKGTWGSWTGSDVIIAELRFCFQRSKFIRKPIRHSCLMVLEINDCYGTSQTSCLNSMLCLTATCGLWTLFSSTVFKTVRCT